MNLNIGEVHLWHFTTAELDQNSLASLSASDLERASKIVSKSSRIEFSASREALRKILSKYLGIAPELIEFDKNEFGKPSVADHQNPLKLQFNLSHSGGRGVLAVTRQSRVGVDIESVERSCDWLSISKESFSPQEFNEMKTLENSEQRNRFFELWTLKESFIKAMGCGLFMPLKNFWFNFTDRGPELKFASDNNYDEKQSWAFENLERSNFKIALCYEKSEQYSTLTQFEL